MMLNGTATIEIAPTLPDFAAQRATKSTLIQSQQMFATYPIQYAPPQYIRCKRLLVGAKQFKLQQSNIE
ncbi:unnamed protein product [Rhizophagus irregularis]|nr:unnamed protein product [Rhizophagus irregularis]